MATLTAVFDSCVLYSAPLADLLMQLAVEDLFHARWTDWIHDEWITQLLKNRPDLDRSRLERRRALMNENARGCVVCTDIPAALVT